MRLHWASRFGATILGSALGCGCGTPGPDDADAGADTSTTSAGATSGPGTTGSPVAATCPLNEVLFGQPAELEDCAWPEANVVCADQGVPFPEDVIFGPGDVWGNTYNLVDFEADGSLALLVADGANQNQNVVYDVASAPIPGHVDVPEGARSAATYDLTQDGIDDVVFLTPEGLVAHEGGKPPLSLTPRLDLPLRDTTSTREAEMLVGDLDGSGLDDLIVVWGSFAGSVTYVDVVLDGMTVVEAQEFDLQMPGQFWSAAVGDVDGDGLDDLVVGPLNGEVEYLAVLLNAGEGQFGPPQALEPPAESGPYLGPPALADLDGDGRAEIIISPLFGYEASAFDVWSYGDDTWSVIHQDGALLATADPLGHDGVLPVATPIPGDFDADGDIDVLLTSAFYGLACSGTQGLSVPAVYPLVNEGGVLQPAPAFSLLDFGHPWTSEYLPALLPSGDLFVYLKLEVLPDGDETEAALVYSAAALMP